MRRLLALLLVAASLTACRGGGRSPTVRGAPPTSTSTAVTAAPTTSLPVAVTPSCPPIPPRAAPPPDRPRYTLHVELRPGEALAAGDLTVRFVPDLPVDRLVFRLWPNGPRIGGAGGQLDAADVAIDGRPVAPSIENPTTLVVPLGRVVPSGTAITAAMTWRLRLPGPIDDRVARGGNSVRLGTFFPILGWEPGVGWALDPPTSAYAEASTATAADFTMSVAAPEGWTVLASGAPDGRGTWTGTGMREVALSAGRFRIATATARTSDAAVPVTVGTEEDLGLAPEPFADKAARSIEDFSRRYGPYPWPAYTLGITAGLRGGVEFPGHVMQGPGTIGRTTSHEVAHQWFYALVGNDQGRDPWIDEALATFAEWRFEGTLESMKGRPIPAAAQGRVGEPMTFWSSREDIYSAGVYTQGAQALAALGSPDLVDCALRIHAAVNAYRIARPADVIRALAAVFPNPAPTLAGYGIKP